MPKKPHRDNPKFRDPRTVQSAASLLRRISQKAGAAAPVLQGAGSSGGLFEGLRAALPAELGTHLISVLEKPDELVFFTESAAWAGRLKLALAELPDLVGKRKVTVRVMPRGGYRR